MPTLLGRIVGEIARAAGNVNPIVVEQKNKNIVKDLRSMEPLFPIYFAPKGYKYKKKNVKGVKTEIFKKKEGGNDNVVLVLHGGAYVSRMMFYYRLLNKRYSIASGGGTVVHFEYRCAPEHTYPAALDDTMKVWNWLTKKQGYKPENIIIVGDSAGGHLCMNLMMKLHDMGRKMPRAALLMSPWLDMTASGPSYRDNYKVDPVFGIRGQTPTQEEVQELLMKSELYMWFGDNDRKDPYISPIYNEFDNTYPPIFVTVGGNEMLRSEAETIVDKFKKAGVEATLYVGDGMFHAFNVYQIFPEAQEALRAGDAFIRKQFGIKDPE